MCRISSPTPPTWTSLCPGKAHAFKADVVLADRLGEGNANQRGAFGVQVVPLYGGALAVRMALWISLDALRIRISLIVPGCVPCGKASL